MIVAAIVCGWLIVGAFVGGFALHVMRRARNAKPAGGLATDGDLVAFATAAAFVWPVGVMALVVWHIGGRYDRTRIR